MFLDENGWKRLAAFLAVHIKAELASGRGDKPLPRLLSVQQAAEYMGRSKSAIERLIFRDELRGCIVRKDRRVHIDRLALDRWIESHRV